MEIRMPKSCRIYRLEVPEDLLTFCSGGFGNAKSEYDRIPSGTKTSVILKATIGDLVAHRGEGMALGTFLYDDPIVIKHRDGSQVVEIQTFPIKFGLVGGRPVLLVIFASQVHSQYVRKRMTPLLAQYKARAVSVKIPTQSMNDFLWDHTHIKKSCTWVGLSIPHLTKARLAGVHIDETADYERYDSHGQKNSITLSLDAYEWTITLSAAGGVTVWREITELEALRFIRDEMAQLCRGQLVPAISLSSRK
jgi:hypothetical protein